MKSTESVGMAIRMARTSRGESQADLGERFGVGHQAVGVWERTGNVPRERWKQFLDEYGVDIEAIQQRVVNVTASNHSHAAGHNMEVTNNHHRSDLSDEESILIRLLREKDPTRIFLRRTIADLIMREEADQEGS